IVSGVLMTKGLGFNEEVLYSITPKSVTTPVAMDISTSLTGIDYLAAVFVIIAGISGAMIGTYIFKVLRLDTNVGCGVAMGLASHASGTAKSLQNSLEQGSISTRSDEHTSQLQSRFVLVYRLLRVKHKQQYEHNLAVPNCL